ncbi:MULTISPECIES: type II toxin-antitoxin system HipA family toxin [unclassified Rhodococcus (in: high G+C Gram-positive bacteria)]|uniref:type II toxin-antitoxin system HipA family toxin n=1 Tax=unclassified Rhodococcus (in: high G+C Gram-positive bacteria) TaxID=192944 RepID=UPI0006FA1209|nr:MULTISPECIES: type II toxin-antitoxin system HipA family toxin [unclassified Rhodococcus (in: high G+C Gram-positive bacteria)]KQU36558.1 protein kinase [Rhodococcus sp. Leaf225]KQU47565.1 protein kinase [Rhodococcus sp. Leaf258]
MTTGADLRDIDRADVYKGNVRAGSLTRSGDNVSFHYDDDYLARPGADPVAWSLPTDAVDVSVGAGSVPPFFAGLLPEGVRLSGVVAGMKTSEDDHFTILLGVGSDTIGDVRVVPHETELQPATLAFDPESPSPDLRALFDQLSGPDSMRVDTASLPGVQGKVSAQMYTSPVATTQGAAILKLAPPERFPRLVENENFFMAVAESCGLVVPRRQIATDARGVSGLLVQRFDGDGDRRLAQEDACQINSLYPSSKYRMKTETVLDTLASTVERGGGSARQAALELLRLTVYSYAIGNGDLHGKNYSIRRKTSGMWGVTPAYDLLCTQPYMGWNDPMALTFYGRNNKWSRDHIVDGAARHRLPRKAVERVLDDVCAGVRAATSDVESIGFDDKTTSRMTRFISARCDELSS